MFSTAHQLFHIAELRGQPAAISSPQITYVRFLFVLRTLSRNAGTHRQGGGQAKLTAPRGLPGRSPIPVLTGPCVAELRNSKEILCIRHGMAVSENCANGQPPPLAASCGLQRLPALYIGSQRIWTVSMVPPTLQWLPVDSHGFLWLPKSSNGFQWGQIYAHGFHWKPANVNCFPWLSMAFL
jgi:hypothetical protein